MIQNLLVACGLALSVGVSSLEDHNTESMRTQSTTIYDGGVTTVTTQYEYQTNEVNSIDDLVEGNIYKFDINIQHLINFNGIRVKVLYDLHMSNTDTTINNTFEGVEMSFISVKDNQYINVGVNHSSQQFNLQLWENNSYKGTLISTPNDAYENRSFYFVYYGYLSGTNISDYIFQSDYLGEEITSVTNVMPTSILEIFDNFINERIFNHSKLSTLKTTIFGQEMSVASWLSLSVSIVLGILFLVVLIKGAIWLFKIVGNLALLR